MATKRMKKAGKKAGKAIKKIVKQAKKDDKMETVMKEFKHGQLRSGSKKGPKVKSRAQAIAIGLSESRRLGKKIKKK